MAKANSTGESSRGAHRITTLMQCPAKFAYSYLLGLEPKEPRPALALGTCNHIGLEAYYNGNDPIDAIMSVGSDVAFRAVDAVKIIEKYARGYPLRRDNAGVLHDVGGEVMYVEKEFRLIIAGEEEMTRRIDLMLVKDGRLIVYDHKGAARPAQRAKGANLDPTMFTQEMVGRRVAKEMSLGWGGLYLNILPTGNQGDFTRAPIDYTQELLNRAEKSLLYWLRQERMITEEHDAGRLDPWQLAQGFQCYPNGYSCDYWGLCTKGTLGLSSFQEKK